MSEMRTTAIMSHTDAYGITVQERIDQALTDTLPDIGQIDAVTRRELNRLVRQGSLSKGKGGPYPRPKTVYARPGFDFAADRAAHVAEAMRWAELDEMARRQQRLRAAIQRMKRSDHEISS